MNRYYLYYHPHTTWVIFVTGLSVFQFSLYVFVIVATSISRAVADALDENDEEGGEEAAGEEGEARERRAGGDIGERGWRYNGLLGADGGGGRERVRGHEDGEGGRLQEHEAEVHGREVAVVAAGAARDADDMVRQHQVAEALAAEDDSPRAGDVSATNRIDAVGSGIVGAGAGAGAGASSSMEELSTTAGRTRVRTTPLPIDRSATVAAAAGGAPAATVESSTGESDHNQQDSSSIGGGYGADDTELDAVSSNGAFSPDTSESGDHSILFSRPLQTAVHRQQQGQRRVEKGVYQSGADFSTDRNVDTTSTLKRRNVSGGGDTTL